MEWVSPFIVYRITSNNRLEEVFHAEDLKKAKYWLTYIAKPGDVLCKTPLHPKHSKQNNKPEYWSHKEKSGQPSSNESEWKKLVQQSTDQVEFPCEQFCLPNEI